MIKCKDCGKIFNFRYLLLRHVNKTNKCFDPKPDTFECKHCNKIYKSKSSLKRHLDNCRYYKEFKMQNIISELQTTIINQKDDEIRNLRSLCSAALSQTVKITNTNNIVFNDAKVSKIIEPYSPTTPVGQVRTDDVMDICVRDKKRSGKIIIQLGKGDVIGPILYIFKSLHMNKHRKDLQNIAYVDNKHMCVVEGEGWVCRSWKYICTKINMEIEIALRRCYDLMDYKSKKAERAVNAMQEIFKIHLSEVVALKDLSKTIEVPDNMNNHIITGMYSTETSQSDQYSDSDSESTEECDSESTEECDSESTEEYDSDSDSEYSDSESSS